MKCMKHTMEDEKEKIEVMEYWNKNNEEQIQYVYLADYVRLMEANKSLQISLDRIQKAEMYHHDLLWRFFCAVKDASKDSEGVYQIAAIHGFKYTGRTYEKEFKEVEEYFNACEDR